MPAIKHRNLVTQTIRAEKARRGVTFGELSGELKKAGVNQTASNLSTKVARGVMDAGLFLAILDALGVERLNIPDLVADIRPKRPKG